MRTAKRISFFLKLPPVFVIVNFFVGLNIANYDRQNLTVVFCRFCLSWAKNLSQYFGYLPDRLYWVWSCDVSFVNS